MTVPKGDRHLFNRHCEEGAKRPTKQSHNSRLLLRVISIILIAAFLVSDVAFAFPDAKSATLAPPLATKPLAQVVQKADGSWAVIKDDSGIKNRWAIAEISLIIGSALRLQLSKYTLISQIKEYIKSKENMESRAHLEGFDIDGIEEVTVESENNVIGYPEPHKGHVILNEPKASEGSKDRDRIIAFTLPIKRNNIPASRWTLSLQKIPDADMQFDAQHEKSSGEFEQYTVYAKLERLPLAPPEKIHTPSMDVAAPVDNGVAHEKPISLNLTSDYDGIVGRYSHMDSRKFRDMVKRLKGGDIDERSEDELKRFDKVLNELKGAVDMLLGEMPGSGRLSVNCVWAYYVTKRIFENADFKYARVVRREFMREKTTSSIFGPPSESLYVLWQLDEEDRMAHYYPVVKVAGEYFVVDLSAGQFFMKDWATYNNLGVFIIPVRDLDEHSWPYAMGRVVESEVNEGKGGVPLDQNPLELQRHLIHSDERVSSGQKTQDAQEVRRMPSNPPPQPDAAKPEMSQPDKSNQVRNGGVNNNLEDTALGAVPTDVTNIHTVLQLPEDKFNGESKNVRNEHKAMEFMATAFGRLKYRDAGLALRTYKRVFEFRPDWAPKIAQTLAEFLIKEPARGQDICAVAYGLKENGVWDEYIKIIALRGGTISVESKVGKGTTFTIQLPTTPQDVAARRNVPIIVDEKKAALRLKALDILAPYQTTIADVDARLKQNEWKKDLTPDELNWLTAKRELLSLLKRPIFEDAYAGKLTKRDIEEELAQIESQIQFEAYKLSLLPPEPMSTPGVSVAAPIDARPTAKEVVKDYWSGLDDNMKALLEGAHYDRWILNILAGAITKQITKEVAIAEIAQILAGKGKEVSAGNLQEAAAIIQPYAGNLAMAKGEPADEAPQDVVIKGSVPISSASVPLDALIDNPVFDTLYCPTGNVAVLMENLRRLFETNTSFKDRVFREIDTINDDSLLVLGEIAINRESFEGKTRPEGSRLTLQDMINARTAGSSDLTGPVDFFQYFITNSFGILAIAQNPKPREGYMEKVELVFRDAYIILKALYVFQIRNAANIKPVAGNPAMAKTEEPIPGPGPGMVSPRDGMPITTAEEYYSDLRPRADVRKAARMIDQLGIGPDDNVLDIGPETKTAHAVSCAARGAKVDICQDFWITFFKMGLYGVKDFILKRIDSSNYQGFAQDVGLPGNNYSYVFLLNVLDETAGLGDDKKDLIRALLASCRDKASVLISTYDDLPPGKDIEIIQFKRFAQSQGYKVEIGRTFKGEETVSELKVTRLTDSTPTFVKSADTKPLGAAEDADHPVKPYVQPGDESVKTGPADGFVTAKGNASIKTIEPAQKELSLDDLAKIEEAIRGFGLQTCLANSFMLIYILRSLGEEVELGGMFSKGEDMPFQYIVLTKKWGQIDIVPYDEDRDDYERTAPANENDYIRVMPSLIKGGYLAKADQLIKEIAAKNVTTTDTGIKGVKLSEDQFKEALAKYDHLRAQEEFKNADLLTRILLAEKALSELKIDGVIKTVDILSFHLKTSLRENPVLDRLRQRLPLLIEAIEEGEVKTTRDIFDIIDPLNSKEAVRDSGLIAFYDGIILAVIKRDFGKYMNEWVNFPGILFPNNPDELLWIDVFRAQLVSHLLGVNLFDWECYYDLTLQQKKIVKSGKSLEFGPGYIYHGRDGLDEVLTSGKLDGDIPLCRVGNQYGIQQFYKKSNSPAIFVVRTELYNQLRRESKANLRIIGERKYGHIDPHPSILVPLGLDDITEIWVNEESFERYQKILNSDKLDEHDYAMKPMLIKLMNEGKLKKISGLRRKDLPEDNQKAFKKTYQAVGRYMESRGLLTNMPLFRTTEAKIPEITSPSPALDTQNTAPQAADLDLIKNVLEKLRREAGKVIDKPNISLKELLELYDQKTIEFNTKMDAENLTFKIPTRWRKFLCLANEARYLIFFESMVNTKQREASDKSFGRLAALFLVKEDIPAELLYDIVDIYLRFADVRPADENAEIIEYVPGVPHYEDLWHWSAALSINGGKGAIDMLRTKLCEIGDEMFDNSKDRRSNNHWSAGLQEILLEAIFLARTYNDDDERAKREALQSALSLKSPHLQRLATTMLVMKAPRSRERRSIRDYKILLEYRNRRIRSIMRDYTKAVLVDKTPLLFTESVDGLLARPPDVNTRVVGQAITGKTDAHDAVRTTQDETVVIAEKDAEIHRKLAVDLVKIIKAKQDKQPLIVALGTRWIPGYNGDSKSPQYKDLNELIVSIRKLCNDKDRGIILVDGDESELLNRIGDAKKTEGFDKAKVVVLTDKSAIDKELASLQNDENATLVGVDNKNIRENEDNYIRIVEMVKILLDLYINPDVTPSSPNIPMERRGRIWYFIPRAERIRAWEKLHAIYEVQKFA